MELELILALGMFLAAIAALLMGYPVALTLGGTALILRLSGSVSTLSHCHYCASIQPHPRRDGEPDADRGAALRADGGDP